MGRAGRTKTDPDEVGLCLTLEALLTGAWGRPMKVRGVQRQPSPFATLFPAEVLSVSLQGGGELFLFVKHLGPEEADHPDKQDRDREVRVYEDLLGDQDLPVVRYYGSRVNGAAQRRAVFLEYVADWNLRYHDLEHWFTAARRLAHLHAYFAARAERLRACDFLLRLDAPYLGGWAARAFSVVAGLSGELAAGLERVVSHYDRVTEVLTRQPVTLVHNDLSPKNVIANRSSRPARICFVDWELAGMGCGLLDLVHLKYGLDPVDDRRMVDAYCAELAGTGLLPTGPRELGRLFAACELHKTLTRLAFSKTWRLPVEKVAEWVSECQAFFSRVC